MAHVWGHGVSQKTQKCHNATCHSCDDCEWKGDVQYAPMISPKNGPQTLSYAPYMVY
jgi:hypothetical protein